MRNTQGVAHVNWCHTENLVCPLYPTGVYDTLLNQLVFHRLRCVLGRNLVAATYPEDHFRFLLPVGRKRSLCTGCEWALTSSSFCRQAVRVEEAWLSRPRGTFLSLSRTMNTTIGNKTQKTTTGTYGVGFPSKCLDKFVVPGLNARSQCIAISLLPTPQWHPTPCSPFHPHVAR